MRGSGGLHRAGARSKSGRRLVLGLFVVSALVYCVSPVITNFDSYSYFPSAVSLVNRPTLSLDAYRNVPAVTTSYTVGHVGPHLLTTYPWAVALFAVPAVLVIDLLHLVGGPSADAVVSHHPQIESLAQLWSASITTAATCALIGLLVYRRTHGTQRTRQRAAFVVGGVFAFGTGAWSTASRALWQHGPAILLLTAGLLGLDRLFPRPSAEQATAAPVSRTVSFGIGLAFAGSVAMRPTNAIPLGLVGLLLAWKARDHLMTYLIGGAILFVPWMAVTDHYYGSLIQPYDQADKLGFTSTFFESIAANLVSPSRGLVIFSPVVLLGVAGAVIARRRRELGPLEVLSVLTPVLYFIVIALYPVWWAGNSFGPRFSTETLPFLVILSVPFVDWLNARRQSRAGTTTAVAASVTIALVAFSIGVNAQGGLLRATECWNGTPNTAQNIDRDPARAWSWGDAQFYFGVRAIASIGYKAILHCPTYD